MMHKAIEKCTWTDVRSQVVAVNPELARLIDHLSPGADYPLYRMSYGFGEQIVKSGQFLYPQGGGRTVFKK